MKKMFSLPVALLLAANLTCVEAGITVYPPVPGGENLDSDHFIIKVRDKSTTKWKTAYAFFTKCLPPAPTTAEKDRTKHYYNNWIGDWSHTYVNFAMDDNTEVATEVEIEIEDTRGTLITSVAFLPEHVVRHHEIRNNKIYVTIDRPCMFSVDINKEYSGQTTMGQSATAWGDWAFPKKPIHSLSIFANPTITDIPSWDGTDVHQVKAGEQPTTVDEAKKIVFFGPGVHNIGKSYTLHKDKSYYIPGDAIVYSTFNNDESETDSTNIRIYGHGTLSGATIDHPYYDQEYRGIYVAEQKELGNTVDPSIEPGFGAYKTWVGEYDHKFKPIRINQAENVTVEGITIADSPNHSLQLVDPEGSTTQNTVKWTKIFTWRGNGDGINPFSRTLIEDCFIRAQDDSLYTNGLGIRRVQIWNDVNGGAFVLSPFGNIPNSNLVIEDCDILFSRTAYSNKPGGASVFNMRGEGIYKENRANGVTFRNIRVLDKFQTQPTFLLQAVQPYDRHKVDSITRIAGLKYRPHGTIKDLKFENITVAAKPVTKRPLVLYGVKYTDTIGGLVSVADMKNFTFGNVNIAGVAIDSITQKEADRVTDVFKTNEATEMKFITTSNYVSANFSNTGADMSWENPVNWGGTTLLPNYLDNVSHTSVAGKLSINTIQHIKSLNISHLNGAELELQRNARLYVSSDIVLGNPGVSVFKGTLTIKGGYLDVDGTLDVGLFYKNKDKEQYKFASKGILIVDGGALRITSDTPNPLRVGTVGTDIGELGLLDLNKGSIFTSGMTVGSSSTPNRSLVRLDGGLLHITGDNAASLTIEANARIHITAGKLVLAGNRVDQIEAFNRAGRITCTTLRKVVATFELATNTTTVVTNLK